MMKLNRNRIILSAFALLIGTASHTISATFIDTDPEQIITSISGEIGDYYSISPDRYELSLTMYCHNGGALLEDFAVEFGRADCK